MIFGTALDYNPNTDTTDILVEGEQMIAVAGFYEYGAKVYVPEEKVTTPQPYWDR